MKKILLLAGFVALFSTNAFALGNSVKEQKQSDTIYFQVIESGSNYMEVLVYENSAVNDFCNFLSQKEVSVTAGLICAFVPGSAPVCTVYAAAMAACSIYEAVKLTIKGDFSNAILEWLSAGTKVYKMSKVDEKTYKIQ